MGDSEQLVPVTQEDRDAARYIYDFIPGATERGLDAISFGEIDDHPFVQAFARHRIAAVEAERERGQREGKAAVCHWLRSHTAVKPTRPDAQKAAALADQFEQSEIPCSAIRSQGNV